MTMENIRETDYAISRPVPGFRHSNDNGRRRLSFGRSLFPEDAVARIYKPARSTTTSANVRANGWRLVFERRDAPFIEPLMGYAGGSDTLTQVELEFPTLQSAICYAERQGLRYVVQRRAAKPARWVKQRLGQRPKGSSHTFSDTTLKRLGLAALQESYGQALDGVAGRTDSVGRESWRSPMDVVSNRTLSLDRKRSILMNWAWTDYLADQATNEGMPENQRPSRLDEVEQALLALERHAGLQDHCVTIAQQAA
jgi:hypothetical protein